MNPQPVSYPGQEYWHAMNSNIRRAEENWERRQPVSLADELRKLVEWIQERKANALRLAESKVGADKDGWLEDAEYYQRIEAALLAQHAVAEPQRVLTEHQRKVEEAAGMPIDWGMANASTVAHAAEQPKLTDIELYALVRRIRTISFDGQAVDLLRAALLTSPVAPPPQDSMQVREWRVALQRIANDDDGSSQCHCECGDDENCCEKVDEFCPHCIAQTVLQKSAPVAPPPPVYFSNSHAVWDVSKIPAELVYPSPAVPADYHCTFCDGNHFENLCPNRCKPEDAAPPVAPGEQPTPRERT